MSGSFEANPDAIRALTAAFSEAQHQTEQVKAELEKPHAEQADFGQSWADPYGKEFVDSMGAIAADLANLAKLFGDVQAQLGQTSDMMVSGETANVGSFQEIGSDSGSDDSGSTSGTDGGSTSESI